MPREKLSERFRPQFLFTLDQIAFILRIPESRVEEYVWVPTSTRPPGNRMQAVIISAMGNDQIRVSESQLDDWAKRVGYAAFAHRL